MRGTPDCGEGPRTVHRSLVTVVPLVLSLLLSSCASGTAGGPGESGAPDSRVLEGVAPVSGKSMHSVRWLEEQIFRLRLPSVARCLERRGRADLVSLLEQDFENSQQMRRMEFPEPETLLSKGFSEGTPGHFDQVGSERDLTLTQECSREKITNEEAARAEALYGSLSDAWGMILVNEVLASESETQAQAKFGECVERQGVPTEFATGGESGTPETGFFGWITHRTQTKQLSRDGLEEARLYVKCGRPLWANREELLTKRRQQFDEAHRDQLAELSELIFEIGG